MIVAPSILTVTKEERSNYLEKLITLGIKYLHLDIMDGKFVPNVTEGVELLKDINQYPFIFDTHLMVEDVDLLINEFAECGSDFITFHAEIKQDFKYLIDKIHRLGKKCGISIKPNTEVDVIIPYLTKLDLVLVMSVEPGFGGQSYIESVNHKIEALARLRKSQGYHYLIEVDGGIKEHHLHHLKHLGVDMVVMGTGLTNSSNPKQIIDEAHKACE